MIFNVLLDTDANVNIIGSHTYCWKITFRSRNCIINIDSNEISVVAGSNCNNNVIGKMNVVMDVYFGDERIQINIELSLIVWKIQTKKLLLVIFILQLINEFDWLI